MGGCRCEAHLQVGWMLDFSGAGTWCCVALRATSLLGSNDRSLTGGEANLAGAQRSDQNKLLHTRRVGGLQDGEGEAGRGRCELWAVRVLLRQGPQPAAGLAGSSSSASSKLGQRSTGHSVHIAQHSAHSTAQRTQHSTAHLHKAGGALAVNAAGGRQIANLALSSAHSANDLHGRGVRVRSRMLDL